MASLIIGSDRAIACPPTPSEPLPEPLDAELVKLHEHAVTYTDWPT